MKQGMEAAKQQRKQWPRRLFGSKTQYLRLTALLTVLVVTAGLFVFRDRLGSLETYKNYGYLGAFIVSAVTSASILLPVPGVAVVFALGALLNPIIVGLTAGIGGGLGELTGYMAGYGGRGVIEHRELYSRMEQWMTRRGSITIFILALIPNPFFDLAGFTAGVLRFPLWKFLIVCLLGKIPRFVGIAIAGAWSLDWVIDSVQRILG